MGWLEDWGIVPPAGTPAAAIGNAVTGRAPASPVMAQQPVAQPAPVDYSTGRNAAGFYNPTQAEYDASAQGKAQKAAEDAAKQAAQDKWQRDMDAADLALKQAQAQALAARNDPRLTAADLAKAQADVAVAEANKKKIELEIANYESPSVRRQAELDAARQKADYEDTKALERQRQQDQAALERQRQQQEFTSGESSLTRDFEAQRQQRELEARRQEADRNAAISLRSQELQALQAQDDWVMNTLKTQIESGKLSLGKATAQWQAYVDKARMPSQILESVGKAIEPMIPYMTSRNAGDSAPGFEAGGPMEQLVKRGGGTYDAANYAIKPVTMSLYDMAKQAGADWSASGKLPDPGKAFSSVPDIKVNPGPSNVTKLSDAGAIKSVMPLPPDIQMTNAERAQVQAAIK